jgi:hypothetical protein
MTKRKCLLCTKRASFNYPGRFPGVYCVEHKEPDMINVTKSICNYPDCFTRPTFNYPGGKPRYCAKHCKAGMICIRGKLCSRGGCRYRAYYNYKTGEPLYCARHKKKGMINLCYAFCHQPGCINEPIYNFPNRKHALYCKLHKKSNMNARYDKTEVSSPQGQALRLVINKKQVYEYAVPEPVPDIQQQPIPVVHSYTQYLTPYLEPLEPDYTTGMPGLFDIFY